MKIMEKGKPAAGTARLSKRKTVPNSTRPKRRGSLLAEERQVAEMERTFTDQWEW